MGKRAAIYLRVSTDEQTTENQERALREVATRSGHEIVAVYRDEGISGSKGRDKRPGFDAMHKDASRRKFDIVMAWSVDRLGRSLQDLIGFLSELHSLGIDLALHQQGIDTTTPAGKAMFQMMGVFAEFERSMIVERVRSGVARAKATGTKSGKAFGRPRTSPEVEQRIREALATPGRPGFHKIAAQFGVATGTVQRIAQGSPLASPNDSTPGVVLPKYPGHVVACRVPLPEANRAPTDQGRDSPAHHWRGS